MNDIKGVFNQYLDINISDNDILEFIEEADGDKDGYLNQNEFFAKLGYQWENKEQKTHDVILIIFLSINHQLSKQLTCIKT